ncbi:MAG TPA: penicillin-binding protein 2 [Candidatus Saccharimonadales bacterium]|nr:penicillin-binding protein 2 [Candidatus Saccharimonadales bacterium]
MTLTKKTRNGNLRLKSLTLGFFAICLAFIAKLFIIQVLDHQQYKALADEQYWNFQQIPAKRGNILSSDGFLLASTQTYYLMYAEPKTITNPNKVSDDLASKLADLHPIQNKTKDEAYVFYKNKIMAALDTNLMWVILEHSISPIEKDQLTALKIAGIGFQDEPVRYYPEGTLLSHVLGYVAGDENGTKRGYFGIEGYLDGDLQGHPGRILQEQDALGNPILIGGHKTTEAINGRNIVLTIDRSVQYLIEKQLKTAVDKYDALAGTVIVMNPQTGDVIAMANYPTYDPSDFSDFSDPQQSTDSEVRKKVERIDSAVSETYEPGSVIKPLTISAAVENKIVTPETTYHDDGPVKYSDYYIDNWDHKHWGELNIIQLLQKSNNIGAAWVGTQVGPQRLSDYFRKFGLGEKTGIELEGEDTGVIRDPKTWTDIDTATASFGQGISATPLQVLNAFNVFANDGKLMKPRIVSKIVDEGKEIDIPVKEVRQVITEQTNKTMVDLLVQAVNGGESKYFNLKDYIIAGKTGTAQIPVNGQYDPDKTNATFVGFLPGNDKFSMIVRLNTPRASIFAAETAVPLWMTIADELTKYYGIPPDKVTQD